MIQSPQFKLPASPRSTLLEVSGFSRGTAKHTFDYDRISDVLIQSDLDPSTDEVRSVIADSNSNVSVKKNECLRSVDRSQLPHLSDDIQSTTNLTKLQEYGQKKLPLKLRDRKKDVVFLDDRAHNPLKFSNRNTKGQSPSDVPPFISASSAPSDLTNFAQQMIFGNKIRVFERSGQVPDMDVCVQNVDAQSAQPSCCDSGSVPHSPTCQSQASASPRHALRTSRCDIFAPQALKTPECREADEEDRRSSSPHFDRETGIDDEKIGAPAAFDGTVPWRRVVSLRFGAAVPFSPRTASDAVARAVGAQPPRFPNAAAAVRALCADPASAPLAAGSGCIEGVGLLQPTPAPPHSEMTRMACKDDDDAGQPCPATGRTRPGRGPRHDGRPPARRPESRAGLLWRSQVFRALLSPLELALLLVAALLCELGRA